MYSYNRWRKVIGLAINSFKSLMKANQLQLIPPTNINYELCSINDWDLARSLVALFVNCLTGTSLLLTLLIIETWELIKSLQLISIGASCLERIGLIVTPRSSTVSFSTPLLLTPRVRSSSPCYFAWLLMATITAPVCTQTFIIIQKAICTYKQRIIENRELVIEQIRQSTHKMQHAFPTRFSAFIWNDTNPVHTLLNSTEPDVCDWSRVFLESSSKLSKYALLFLFGLDYTFHFLQHDSFCWCNIDFFY